VPYLFISLLFSLAFGFFITGLIFRYTIRVQMVAWSFAGILQPLSCVMYLLSTPPTWLQRPALWLPTTHVFEAMRQSLNGGEFSPSHFWWGFGLSVVYLVLAVLFLSGFLR